MSKFVSKQEEVEAIKLIADIFNKDGARLASKGDWLITKGTEQTYMSEEEFAKTYTLKWEPIYIYLDRPTPYQPIVPMPNTPWYYDPGPSDGREYFKWKDSIKVWC